MDFSSFLKIGNDLELLHGLLSVLQDIVADDCCERLEGWPIGNQGEKCLF